MKTANPVSFSLNWINIKSVINILDIDGMMIFSYHLQVFVNMWKRVKWVKNCKSRYPIRDQKKRI